MCGMTRGREGRLQRIKRGRLGPALAQGTEAQGPTNHPPNDDAHLPMAQMTRRHDQLVAGDAIDNAIESFLIAHIACPWLGYDRRVDSSAQQNIDRARTPHS